MGVAAGLGQVLAAAVAVAVVMVLHLKNLDRFVAVVPQGLEADPVVAVVAVAQISQQVVSSHCIKGTWRRSSNFRLLSTIRVVWRPPMGFRLCPFLNAIGIHCTWCAMCT